MMVLPVIVRELRAESRHPLTYWLRTLGAAALLAAALLFWSDSGFRQRQGAQLFGVLHQTLFWSIWILVPLLTADCLSRERREGTLGLLFLTPLRARDIVVAKGLAHGLRGLTVCFAASPVVVLPFLMGGVDWRIAIASLLLNLTSFVWSLSAGLLASSRNRTMASALCWAALWAFLLFWVMVWVCGFLFVTFVFSQRGSMTQLAPVVTYFGAGLAAVLSFFHMWQWSMSRIPAPGQPVWLQAYGWVLVVSVIALAALWQFAAWNIRHAWQDKPPSRRRQQLEQRLFTPAFGLGFFRRWMRSMLERNPIGWLERRTWSGRLVSWSWLAVMIGIYTWALNDLTGPLGLRLVSEVVPVLLMGSVAMSAAGSFRRERELGVMELLLVTPLRPGQIVSGRLRGLWGQFLPAILLLMGLWLVLTSSRMLGDNSLGPGAESGASIWLLVFAFLTLPVIGLYFSLRCRHYIVALLLTALVGMMLPFTIVRGMVEVFRLDESLIVSLFVVPGVVLITGVLIALLALGRDYQGVVGRALGFLAFLGAFLLLGGALSSRSVWGEMFRVIDAAPLLLFPAIQMAVALALGWRLHRRLVHRTFAFQV